MPEAAGDLARLIQTHSLPADTRERLRRALAPLERFPRMGAQLGGRWAGFRFVPGPWRWMIVVYAYEESDDVVAITTIQDGRSSPAPTAA